MKNLCCNLFLCLFFSNLLVVGSSYACDIIYDNGFDQDPRLVHQWTFNEVGGAVMHDNVCGSVATIQEVGSSNAVVLNGRVFLGGGAQNNADYVSLPDDLFSGLDDVTIELWAGNFSTQAWSRVFDFGPTQSDYLTMSWNRFTDPITDLIEWKNTNNPGFTRNDTMQHQTSNGTKIGYDLIKQRHIVMTIDENANAQGQTKVSWFLDGVLKNSVFTDLKISDLGKSSNWLGRSKYPDQTANAWYDEFSVYSGVMTPTQVKESFYRGPNNFLKVNAATYYPNNDKYYLFSGTNYFRFGQSGVNDDGYPRSTFTFWDGWSPSWGLSELDAIIYYPVTGKYYLFKGNEFILHSHAIAPDPGYPLNISNNWGGWPVQWGAGGLDAGVYYPGNSKFYLFKGNQYIRQSLGAAVDSGYPKSITGNWSGWPAQWGSGNLDALLYYPGNSKYYLFKGNEYVRHSHGQGPDSGYPKPIEGNWAIEKRKTAVNLFDDLNSFSTSYPVYSWTQMDFPSNYGDRGDSAHIQGIAKVGNTYVLTHNREDYRGFIIYGNGSNWTFNAATPSLGFHPGGTQASGDVVAITYKTDSNGIKFFKFDSSGDYVVLDHLQIPTGKGEAVGIGYHPEHRRYYVIDGSNTTSGNSPNHIMYRSTIPGAPLTDPLNRFIEMGKINVYGSAGGMQLMYDDTTSSMLLVALSRTDEDNIAIQNIHRLDVSYLDLDALTSSYAGFRDDFNTTDNIFADPTFRFGAGMLLNQDTGRLSLIGTERCIPSESGASPAPCIPFQNEVDYFIIEN